MPFLLVVRTFFSYVAFVAGLIGTYTHLYGLHITKKSHIIVSVTPQSRIALTVPEDYSSCSVIK